MASEFKELPKKKLKPIVRCCISHCKNDQPPFFSFPKTGSVRNSWEEATGKFNVKTFSNQKVCMKHFSPDDLVRDLKSELLGLPAKPKLKPETIPHLNLVKQETIIEKSDMEKDIPCSMMLLPKSAIKTYKRFQKMHYGGFSDWNV